MGRRGGADGALDPRDAGPGVVRRPPVRRSGTRVRRARGAGPRRRLRAVRAGHVAVATAAVPDCGRPPGDGDRHAARTARSTRTRCARCGPRSRHARMRAWIPWATPTSSCRDDRGSAGHRRLRRAGGRVRRAAARPRRCRLRRRRRGGARGRLDRRRDRARGRRRLRHEQRRPTAVGRGGAPARARALGRRCRCRHVRPGRSARGRDPRARRRAGVLAVGGPGVAEALRARGLVPVSLASEQPAAVLMGYGPDVSWRDLAQASYAVGAGAVFVATNTDLSIPTARGDRARQRHPRRRGLGGDRSSTGRGGQAVRAAHARVGRAGRSPAHRSSWGTGSTPTSRPGT